MVFGAWRIAQRKVLTQVLEHVRQQIRELQGPPLELQETLTDREREIVKWVMQGMLNKEIATDLGISEKTVKMHRAQMLARLEARSSAEAVRLVVEAGTTTRPGGDPRHA